MEPLRAEPKLLYRLFVVAAATVFASLAGLAERAGQQGLVYAFLFLAYWNLAVLVMLGSTFADEDAIYWVGALGRWQMKWSEVTYIELTPNKSLMLYGDGKQLLLPLGLCNEAQGEAVSELIHSRTWSAQIEDRPMIWKLSKNTRAPRP